MSGQSVTAIRVVMASMLTVLIVACRGEALSNEAVILPLASATTKLSAAVESTCRYKQPPEGTTDTALIERATAHDPALVRPFVGYVVKARCEQRHGLVLVCSANGEKALLEDNGCTGAFDRHAWREESAAPCEYRLAVREVCG